MKKITALVLALMMCVSAFTFTASAAELKFEDVTESNWFYTDVKNAVELGLINGKSETVYAPNDNLTYAEAIKLAACMHQVYMDGVVTLKNGSPWYQTYVDYCIENGIIEKEYEYSEKATRAGYMGIFANALPDNALKAINNVPDNSIPDVPSMRAYADGVYKLYRAGILQGVDAEHNCNPIENIKRSEVATILSRMMDETKRVKFSMGDEEEATEGGTSEEKEETKDEAKEEEKAEEKTPLAIKTQPENTEVVVNSKDKAVFTVEVTGGAGDYTYQWQKQHNNVWYNLTEGPNAFGVNTQTLEFIIFLEGSREIRCIVSDKEGNTVTSDVAIAKFFYDESEEAKALAIKTQPVDVEGATLDATVDFHVEVEGGKAPYTYQWQCKLTAGASFKDLTATSTGTLSSTGFDTDTVTVPVKGVGSDRYQYQCIITDANGDSVTTNAVSYKIGSTSEALAIKTQPVAVSVKVGETATITVEVEGGKAPYTYQWRNTVTVAKTVTTNLEDSSTISGVATDTLTITSATSGTTYNVSCKITDADGNSVTSETVTVQFTEASSGGKDKYEKTESEEPKNEDFAMTIDDWSHITSTDALVLKGKVSAGKVNVGDTIYINDANGKYVTTTKVTRIAMFNKSIDEAKKGDSPGIYIDLDATTWKTKLERGYVASATKGTFSMSRPSVITRPGTSTGETEEKVFYAEVTAMVSTNDSGKISYVANVFNGSGDYSYLWERSIDGNDWESSSYKTNTREFDARTKSYIRCKITDNSTGEVIYTPVIAPNMVAKYGPFENVKNDSIKAVYVHPTKIDTFDGKEAMYTSKDYELNAVVIGGTAPYTYQWFYAEKNSDNFEVFGTNQSSIKLVPSEELAKFKCVVTDANGKTVTSEIFNVTVVIDLSGN